MQEVSYRLEMACRGSALYRGLIGYLQYRGRCGPRPPGGRPNSNLLRPAGLPDFESKGPGSIPGSRGVRIWPRLGKQDFVCIPGIVSLVGGITIYASPRT